LKETAFFLRAFFLKKAANGRGDRALTCFNHLAKQI